MFALFTTFYIKIHKISINPPELNVIKNEQIESKLTMFHLCKIEHHVLSFFLHQHVRKEIN